MSLTAAETHEVTQLDTAHRKIYVLDTNVLLHDPTAITAFAEHQVVIPMTVLEELDHIKDRRDKSVSREARIAIQLIDKIVGSASPQTFKRASRFPDPISMRIGLAP
jgi:PhoH-like ATPase